MQEYKEAIKARDEAEDRYLRAAAEFANARRRAEVRADSEVRAAKELILSSFLPVVDDLDRALLTVPAGNDAYPWLEGFSLIQRKLGSALERQGVGPPHARSSSRPMTLRSRPTRKPISYHSDPLTPDLRTAQ